MAGKINNPESLPFNSRLYTYHTLDGREINTDWKFDLLDKSFTGTMKFVEYSGMTVHYVNGLKHCENGPALIYDGIGERQWYRQWYLKGQLHREDGPALEYLSGLGYGSYFYLHDMELNEADYWREIYRITEDKSSFKAINAMTHILGAKND